MELQSQSNSTDTEIVQDEQKHSAPVLSGTHSKGIHKCFHGGCGSKVVASKSLKVFQKCHLASSAEQISWAQVKEPFSALTSY